MSVSSSMISGGSSRIQQLTEKLTYITCYMHSGDQCAHAALKGALCRYFSKHDHSNENNLNRRIQLGLEGERHLRLDVNKRGPRSHIWNESHHNGLICIRHCSTFFFLHHTHFKKKKKKKKKRPGRWAPFGSDSGEGNWNELRLKIVFLHLPRQKPYSYCARSLVTALIYLPIS